MSENLENEIAKERRDKFAPSQDHAETARELLRSSTPHQRALLRIIATCHCYQLDPHPMLLGLASEVPGRRNALQLNQLSESLLAGVELVDALKELPGLLTPSSQMAIQLASDDGDLTELYSALLDRYPEDEEISGGLNEEGTATKIVRLAARASFIFGILGFIMLKIVPEFQKMFEEFGIELPNTMRLLMTVADRSLLLGPVIPFLFLIAVPFFIPAFRRYINRWNPVTWRVPDSSHAASQRRSLAMISETKQTLSRGITLLSKVFPFKRGARRLEKANLKISEGQNQWSALATAGAISNRDARALSTSESRETQAWLLRWSANDHGDRAKTRSAFIIRLVFAIVHIGLGLLVFLTAIAIFMSLITIINSI